MRDYFGRTEGHINRGYLYDKLMEANRQAAGRATVITDGNPVVIDEGNGQSTGGNAYAIGYQLGQIDAYKHAMQLLDALPDEDPNPNGEKKKAWHHSE